MKERKSLCNDNPNHKICEICGFCKTCECEDRNFLNQIQKIKMKELWDNA